MLPKAAETLCSALWDKVGWANDGVNVSCGNLVGGLTLVRRNKNPKPRMAEVLMGRDQVSKDVEV